MLCEAIALETWTFTAQLVVNVCGKLLQLGCPNAMQGLEELLDAREEDAAENVAWEKSNDERSLSNLSHNVNIYLTSNSFGSLLFLYV
uniref:MIF4G_like_2 domain-containing protein n=1 Tax=Heterorhabditis bacteriophora TaxID=37862 RepID=A0A1I7WJS8_HETBA